MTPILMGTWSLPKETLLLPSSWAHGACPRRPYDSNSQTVGHTAGRSGKQPNAFPNAVACPFACSTATLASGLTLAQENCSLWGRLTLEVMGTYALCSLKQIE
jgi:hypothetical protein